MSTRDLHAVFVEATTETLPQQTADGGLLIERWSPMMIHCWTLCYTQPYADNPHHRDPAVLDAIRRLGDFNAASLDPARGFMNDIPGWDEWRIFAWMEAMELLRPELDAPRLAAWERCFHQAGDHVYSQCLDMETFDGVIPNHGIWNHAMMYRIGQLYDRPELAAMAAHAFSRIFAGQTADGCFREGTTPAGFPGSPVTMYNVVSMLAINMYHGHSQDPAALVALERGWEWYYRFLFPDYTMPPALDSRVHYNHGHRRFIHPAYFSNRPEIRAATEAFWAERVELETVRSVSGVGSCHAIGFLTLQADKILAEVTPVAPTWPEYHRMLQDEACIRRRHGWHAVLSGITNAASFSHELPLWRYERLSLVNIYHDTLGLIVGASNSVVQEEIAQFSFYERGTAHYLHDSAYLKSTPPLDTLHLQYGGNTGTVSVDTTRPDTCEVILSIHGELGSRPTPGPGHNLSAVAAKARLSLRLQTGDRIEHAGRERILSEDGFILRLEPGDTVCCPGYTISTNDTPWTLRWPLHTHDSYSHLRPDDELAIAEAVLYHKATSTTPRPTVRFTIALT